MRVNDGQGRGNSSIDPLEINRSTALRTSWMKHSSDKAKNRKLKERTTKSKKR